MKKLDIYLIRQFLLILTMTLLGFICIIVVVDLIENLDRFIDSKVPIHIVLVYYTYSLPWFLNIGLPMSMLISTVFSVGLMAKRNELTVMKSSGVSLYRIAFPLIIMGVIVSYLSFELDNTLVTTGNEKRYEIEREYMKRRARKHIRNVLRNVFLQKQEKTHISLGTYQMNQKSGRTVTVLTLEEGIIRRRLDAKKIEWIDSLSTWAVSNFSIRNFKENGAVANVILSSRDSLIKLGFTPEDIAQRTKLPDEMNYQELTRRIQQLKENGIDTTKWEVDQHFKIAFAFTNLIIVMFGLPLVVLKDKGGLSFGAGMGIFVIFVYYAFLKFGLSLGYKGVLDPLAAAWMGNIVFSLGGITLLITARK
ncbi:MAG: LptF/LptG family permease [Fidelibacterota bacterium]